ncbi:MAG: TIGR03435 family protein [Terracidiphilus sp.]
MLRAFILLASALLLPFAATAQAPKTESSPKPAPTPSFDVVSIHLSPPSPDGHNHIWNDVHESHFRTGNLSIRDLIQYAYYLPKSQILGGPPWLNSAMYDIDAKSDPEVDARLKAMPGDAAAQQKRLMVQALLADRFAFAAHHETRELPIYNLVLAKGGAKFQPSDRSGTTIDTWRSRMHVAGSDDTIGLLARELAQLQGRVVVNKTGLSGRYDLTLRWTPHDAPPPLLNGAPDPNAPPGLFTAIQEQLGLKLESSKGPVDVLVIDKIEQPSPN